MPENAVTFGDGRVHVSGPLPPGDAGFMIRYRLETLESTFPAPGRTERFEIWIEEPSPPLRIDGLEFSDSMTIEGSTFRVYEGSQLVDLNLAVVQTEHPSLPPFEWAALLMAIMLAAIGSWAYLQPRRRVCPAEDSGVAPGALMLDGARIGPPDSPGNRRERR
jgi:hypothetical protein